MPNSFPISIFNKTNSCIGFKGYLYYKAYSYYKEGQPFTLKPRIILGGRPYDPAIRCFLSPDSWSPYGVAGPNRFTYCNLDPINRFDPDGHMSTSGKIQIGFAAAGIFFSLLMIPVAAKFFLMGAIAAGALATTSFATGIASSGFGIAAAVGENDTEYAEDMNMASMILGGISIITAFGAPIAARMAARTVGRKLAHAGLQRTQRGLENGIELSVTSRAIRTEANRFNRSLGTIISKPKAQLGGSFTSNQLASSASNTRFAGLGDGFTQTTQTIISGIDIKSIAPELLIGSIFLLGQIGFGAGRGHFIKNL